MGIFVPIGNNKVMINTDDIHPKWIGEMCKYGKMTDDVIDDLDKLEVGRKALIDYENMVWKERKIANKQDSVTIWTEDAKNKDWLQVTEGEGIDLIPGYSESEVDKLVNKGEVKTKSKKYDTKNLRSKH